MRYNRLGNSGLVVSELCLGAMTFGNRASRFLQHELDQNASTVLVKQAVDGGVNFIDTANIYTGGQSEEFVGGAIKSLGLSRGEIVITTKGMGAVGDGPNDGGTSRYHMLNQIDESLKRLQLDHVDMYQIHGWDPTTPLEETLRAMEDIVRSGRARYIGVSNWAAWQIAKALGIAERRGWDKLISLQAYYTVASRDLERELVPVMRSEGVGLMVWSPMAGGLLSGKYTRGKDGETAGEGRRAKLDFPQVDKDKAFALVDAMRPMAEVRGKSVASIALSWLLHQKVVTSVILGVKRPDQLADNLASSEIELTSDELATLGALGALESEYPAWGLAIQHESNNGRISPRREPK